MHSGEVVYSLVRLHLEQELWVYGGIEPVYIPVRVVSFRPRDLVVERLRDIPQHIILRVL